MRLTIASSGSKFGSTPNSPESPPPPPPPAPPISISPPASALRKIGLDPIRSDKSAGPGSTDRKCELSEEEVASTRAASLVSFVSVVEAGAGAADDEEEEEGREGIERSTSGVPNETMSSATLFFFNFLPSCKLRILVSL